MRTTDRNSAIKEKRCKVITIDIKTKLPIGIENFEEIRTLGFYYVDKTALIKDLLNDWGKVNLFTRPRRFGKSLNINMLKYFFEYGCDSRLFDGLEISKEQKLCADHMGKYPVISVTLKGVSSRNFDSARGMLCTIIGSEALRFQFLSESDKLSDEDKDRYRQLIHVDASGQHGFIMLKEVLEDSLRTLTYLLHKHYGQKVILLIDEYDVPLDKAQISGYYDDMIGLIRNLFGQALKSNDSLFFAVLTGCLKVAHESIFTGLNNLRTFSITNAQFDEHFGFTDEEVRTMLEFYGMGDRFGLTKEWYDGYRFGDADVYCPWDVINYCAELRADPRVLPRAYWLNTSGNDIIRKFIQMAEPKTKREIECLIDGGSVEKKINQELTYRDLYQNIENIWSVLFATGYLTRRKTPLSHLPGRTTDSGHTAGSDGPGGSGPTESSGCLASSDLTADFDIAADKEADDIFYLVIPNLEIKKIFIDQVMEWFQEESRKDAPKLDALCDAFARADAAAVEECFNAYLRRTISIRDTSVRRGRKENFYHGILLGLLSHRGDWIVSSNMESGDGFSDILVELEEEEIGIVIEVKYPDGDDLENGCRKALAQIERMNYEDRLRQNGLTTIYKYGIACHKKRCRVLLQEQDRKIHS